MNSKGEYNVRGRYYEVLFKSECLKRDLLVLTPECAHLPFDVAIFSHGKFLTVQVKGTSVLRRHHNSGREARFQCCRTVGGKSYSERGVDYFAAYVEPEKAWFIVPSANITSRTFGLRVGPHAKSNEWRERWEFLGAALEVD